MRYRKKPVEVKAIQFWDDPGIIKSISDFLGKDIVVDYKNPTKPVLDIETLEGVMTAKVGDYIIRGVNGEFYPCKPDIFEKTYEKVSE
ncbi:hypothetical protein SAMN05192534_12341 [Alteribacillus persepolensis]|uniref:Phage protein n=1 Tax=Alteribacillus persepolensis TaxID=568899 RepID=A0A1G8I8C2_9BACI|nr:hypothetical protein [Alteribacillus persepolensis]SDI15235.1 hypothetical protein SAMN05192534_12341 [Alteribacillus persepolensis]